MNSLLNKINDNYVITKMDVLNVTLDYIRENNLSYLLNDIHFSSNNTDLAYYNSKDKLIKCIMN